LICREKGKDFGVCIVWLQSLTLCKAWKKKKKTLKDEGKDSDVGVRS
jgi:hypothetical protein